MKKILLVLLLFITIISCVPQNQYKELEQKYYAALQGESKSKKQVEEKLAELNKIKSQYTSLKEQQESLVKKKEEMDKDYENLQLEYTSRLKEIVELKEQNREYLSEVASNIESKKRILGDLEQTQTQLKERIKRIDELEELINQQKEAVSGLKEKLQRTLKNYEGKGITVEEKEGSIYVSMENKLIFPSASWTVETEGLKALHELSTVLANDENLNIIIQGNTDSDKYSGNGYVKDNWDLSVMRATSITKVLQAEGVSPTQMTASGRGEYLPVADNSTVTGKAMNRRVDIIIAPNLSEITTLLNEL